MAVEQLSAADESRIMRALEKAAAMTRTGASPDEALIKSAKELGLNPEMTKVACQAFNKSKSVYMLSKLSADRRGEPFDLSDPEKVVSGVFETKQAAVKNTSLDNIMKDFTSLGLMTKAACATALQKTASENEPKGDALRDLEYKRDMREVIRALDKFDKLHGDMQMRKTAAELAVQDACDRLVRTPKAEIEKLARVVVNRYGDDGVRFMRLAQAKLGLELDLRKTASAAAIPAKEPYFSVVRSMEAMESYNKSKENLESVAREALKKRADVSTTMLAAPIGLAAGGLVTGPFDVARDIVPSEVSKWQQLAMGSGNQEAAINEALDPVLLKKIENMDLEDAWVDMSKDKFIASHPRAKVLEAISDVVNVMPSMKIPHNKPLLQAMVRKQLSQGGAIDPVEVGQLASTEKTLAQSIQERAAAANKEVASRQAGTELGPVKAPSVMDLPAPEFTSGQAALDALRSLKGPKDKQDK